MEQNEACEITSPEEPRFRPFEASLAQTFARLSQHYQLFLTPFPPLPSSSTLIYRLGTEDR